MRYTFLYFLCWLPLVTGFGQYLDMGAQSGDYPPLDVTYGKVYDKHSGLKLSNTELDSLFEIHPFFHVDMEYEIGRDGTKERYWFKPADLEVRSYAVNKRHLILRPLVGKKFPGFLMKTIDGETIDSDSLLGQYVLLRFDNATEPRLYFQPRVLKKVSDTIQSRKLPVVPIVVFGMRQFEFDRFPVNSDSLGFNVVINGNLFGERYHLKRFPTTILLDPQGVVLGYYIGRQKIDWSLVKN